MFFGVCNLEDTELSCGKKGEQDKTIENGLKKANPAELFGSEKPTAAKENDAHANVQVQGCSGLGTNVTFFGISLAISFCILYLRRRSII